MHSKRSLMHGSLTHSLILKKTFTHYTNAFMWLSNLNASIQARQSFLSNHPIYINAGFVTFRSMATAAYAFQVHCYKPHCITSLKMTEASSIRFSPSPSLFLSFFLPFSLKSCSSFRIIAFFCLMAAHGFTYPNISKSFLIFIKFPVFFI